MAGQSVVGDRLPRRGVGDELADARSDPGIAVERAHANREWIGMARVVSEERGAAVPAEPFLATTLGPPHAQPVPAGGDAERVRRRMRVRGRRRAAATLTARAMAITGQDERSGHLEPDRSTIAAAREGEVGHPGAPPQAPDNRQPIRLAVRPRGPSPGPVEAPLPPEHLRDETVGLVEEPVADLRPAAEAGD